MATMEITNAQRAHLGASAVAATPGGSNDEKLIDLLANLMHWASWAQIDFAESCRIAQNHFVEESIGNVEPSRKTYTLVIDWRTRPKTSETGFSAYMLVERFMELVGKEIEDQHAAWLSNEGYVDPRDDQMEPDDRLDSIKQWLDQYGDDDVKYEVVEEF
jgi:hypothetical protein